MRVCIISTYPPEKCGVGYNTSKLVSELRNYIQICVISNIPGVARSSSGSEEGVKIARCWRKNDPMCHIDILKAAIRERTDIYHIQHHYLLYGGEICATLFIVLPILLKLTRKPVLITMHSVIPIRYLKVELFERYSRSKKFFMIKKLVLVLVTKIIGLMVDAIVVTNRQMKEALVKEYKIKDKKIFILPHGVEQVPLLNQGEAKRILGVKGRKVILFQGFIAPGKGIEYLVRAFERVEKKKPHVMLVIAGGYQRHIFGEKPEYARIIEEVIRTEKLKKKVMVTGFVQEENLPLYISAADIIVLPYSEKSVVGSSGALYRVALSGKPLVVTKVPKLTAKLDNEDAIFVKPMNEEELAQAILSLFSNKELGRRIAENLRKKALAETYDKVALNTLKVYNQMVKRKKGRQTHKLSRA